MNIQTNFFPAQDPVSSETAMVQVARRIAERLADGRHLTRADVNSLFTEATGSSDADHGWTVHQEDFCQALGILSSRKYASEGGPGFRECFVLVRTSASRPAVEVLKLLDAAIFNLLAGNADAHGKNYSLLYNGDETRLAPLYDLLATIVYPGLDDRLAMKIGGEGKLEEIQARHLERFAVSIGMTPAYVKRRAKKLSDLVKSRAPILAAELSEEFSFADRSAFTEVGGLIEHRAQGFFDRL